MEPFLIAVRGPLRGQQFPLSKKQFRIGRGAENDVDIPDEHVSHIHATVSNEQHGFILTDEQSFNGTYVNGLRVLHAALGHGDRIDVGRSAFTLVIDAPGIKLDDLDFAAASQETVALNAENAEYPLRISSDDGDLARTARDLQALLQISQTINSLHSSQDIQEALLNSVFQATPAEKGAILLLGDEPDRFSGTYFRHRDGMAVDVRVSKSVCARVLGTGRAELLNNVWADANSSVSLLDSGVASMICVPLSTPEKKIGVIHVDTTAPNVHFDDKHLQILMSIAGIGAIALRQALYVEWLEAENQILTADAHITTEMVGDSAEMKTLHRWIGQYAPSTAPVLIEGETGTGKELVARAIHRNSRRSGGPFVDINCSLLLKDRAESELFGHERGAFTDARTRHEGYFERAQGGTLFLDEIGDLALDVQTMLLRALQEKTIRRMGGTESIVVDVRIVAATNQDLREKIAKGTFRRDLYERLRVIHIAIPPLRERRDDIPALAYHFVRKYSQREGREIVGLTPAALKSLQDYSWPHNIRELENRIWRAVLDARTNYIDLCDLPQDVITEPAGAGGDRTLEGVLMEAKRSAVHAALRESDGVVKEAARRLGIEPNSLSRIIRELGLKYRITNPD